MTDEQKIQMVLQWAEKHPEFRENDFVEEIWDRLDKARSTGAAFKMTLAQRNYIEGLIFKWRIDG